MKKKQILLFVVLQGSYASLMSHVVIENNSPQPVIIEQLSTIVSDGVNKQPSFLTNENKIVHEGERASTLDITGGNEIGVTEIVLRINNRLETFRLSNPYEHARLIISSTNEVQLTGDIAKEREELRPPRPFVQKL